MRQGTLCPKFTIALPLCISFGIESKEMRSSSPFENICREPDRMRGQQSVKKDMPFLLDMFLVGRTCTVREKDLEPQSVRGSGSTLLISSTHHSLLLFGGLLEPSKGGTGMP